MANLEVRQSARQQAGRRWLPSLSLRQRILLLLALAGLPGIAVAIFLAAAWLQDQTQQIEVSVQRLAKLAAAQHETVIENARILSAALAQGHTLDDLRSDDCRAYLSEWLEGFPALTSLSLFDDQGLRVCATADAGLPVNAGQADWFNQARAEKTFILGRYTVLESGSPVLVAAHPMLDDAQEFKGTVSVGIDLRWLSFLSNTIELPEDATISAVTEEGTLLLHSAAAPPAEDAEVGAPPSPQALSQLAVLSGGTLRAENAYGSPRVYGIQKTTTGGIVVAIGHTPYLGYARYRDALVNTLASPLLVLVLALIAAGYAAEAFVARYVRSLTQTAEAIGQGDLSARSEIPYGKYEIGRLAAAFDGMAEAIEKNQNDLGDLVEEREMLIRELNHRVKNNLQIVLSMLHGTDREADDPAAKARMKTLAGRVQTLAQIHQLLYQRYDTAAPELGSYVRQLTTLLGEFYEAEVGPAKVGAEVADIDLTLSQCISFGLVLNELVANAQKHAFKEGEKGQISIVIRAETVEGVTHVHLTVSDDGVGLPSDYDLEDATSTGSRLLRALAQSLEGDIWCERLQPGTAMHVRFPVG